MVAAVAVSVVVVVVVVVVDGWWLLPLAEKGGSERLTPRSKHQPRH